MIRQYETTFIVNPHLSQEETEACIQKYVQWIEKNGGKIKRVERWGKRRLAYEIKKQQYGFYAYIRFEGEGTLCQELEKTFKLDENILRSLTVVLTKAALKEELRQLERPSPEKTFEEPEIISLSEDEEEIAPEVSEDEEG